MSILLQKRADVLILLLKSSWHFCACKCGFGALSAGHVRGTLSLSSLDSRGQVEPERTRLWNYADRVNWKKQVWTSRHVTSRYPRVTCVFRCHGHRGHVLASL